MHIYTSTTTDGNLSYIYGEHEQVEKNRSSFFVTHGIDQSRVVYMSCEHAEKIVRVGTEDAGSIIPCEALITNEKKLALFLLTADCSPLTIHDPVHNAVGIAHLGWKPTARLMNPDANPASPPQKLDLPVEL